MLFPHFTCHHSNDNRGLLFAVYSISEDILGIGPFDKWLGIDAGPPVPQLSLANLPRPLPRVYPSPRFRIRAFFVNDEELFGGWANSPDGLGVWSSAQWDMLYESILRLKANGILPGTNTFPGE